MTKAQFKPKYYKMAVTHRCEWLAVRCELCGRPISQEEFADAVATYVPFDPPMEIALPDSSVLYDWVKTYSHSKCVDAAGKKGETIP